MKIYFAANPGKGFCNRDAVAEMMSKVRAAGHIITFDWLTARPKELEPGLEAVRRMEAALNDLEGVRQCEVLLLIDDEFAKGIYTELGAALALDKWVIVVGMKYNQVFFSHPKVLKVESLDQAITMLSVINNVENFEKYAEFTRSMDKFNEWFNKHTP